jgi:hypothetical protein
LRFYRRRRNREPWWRRRYGIRAEYEDSVVERQPGSLHGTLRGNVTTSGPQNDIERLLLWNRYELERDRTGWKAVATDGDRGLADPRPLVEDLSYGDVLSDERDAAGVDLEPELTRTGRSRQTCCHDPDEKSASAQFHDTTSSPAGAPAGS